MDDITISLLEEIRNEFQREIEKSETIKAIYEKIKNKTATYVEADEYAVESARILTDAYQHHISSRILPDGKIDYDMAKAIISPTMQQDYEIVSGTAYKVQQCLNEKAGIGIKAIKPKLNNDRIYGIIDKISKLDNYDAVVKMLDEPIVNFSQSIVIDSIKENFEMQGKVGLKPTIVRKLAGRCCKWCASLAGTYRYPDVPADVYKRHQRCRCTVEYDPGSGKRQDVWSKQWKDSKKNDKIEARKLIVAGGIGKTAERIERELEEKTGLAYQISTHPKLLQSYTPEGLKKALEDKGYEVKTLGAGNFKGISLEDGGGFRVSYGGDRYLQYHPASRSHHGGEYYKTSNGVDGKHRYNMEGVEIDQDGTIKRE